MPQQSSHARPPHAQFSRAFQTSEIGFVSQNRVPLDAISNSRAFAASTPSLLLSKPAKSVTSLYRAQKRTNAQGPVRFFDRRYPHSTRHRHARKNREKQPNLSSRPPFILCDLRGSLRLRVPLKRHAEESALSADHPKARRLYFNCGAQIRRGSPPLHLTKIGFVSQNHRSPASPQNKIRKNSQICHRTGKSCTILHKAPPRIGFVPQKHSPPSYSRAFVAHPPSTADKPIALRQITNSLQPLGALEPYGLPHPLRHVYTYNGTSRAPS